MTLPQRSASLASLRLTGAGGIAAWLLPALPTPAAALPPNPERPMAAASCTEALARVREAAEGSPLVSADENKRLLAKALEDAGTLCTDRPDGEHGKGQGSK